MKKITFEEFKEDVLTAMVSKPKDWRNGQFVFNYINEKYRVARYVQFINGVDCFHNDEKIDEFIVRCYETMMTAESYRDVFEGNEHE